MSVFFWVNTHMARKILRPSVRRKNGLIQNSTLREQKRQAVANAAFDLFLRDGFHKTTTRDIARQAGMSNGALFSYFKDKEELLFFIISHEQERAEQHLVEQLHQASAVATQTHADPEDVFCGVFTTFVRGVDHMRRFILLAYQETKSLNPATRLALIEREKRIQAALSSAIQYGVEQGRFAPDAIELKAHNLMVLAHAWAVRRWAFVGQLESVDDYLAFLLPQALALLRPARESALTKKRGKQPRPDKQAAA